MLLGIWHIFLCQGKWKLAESYEMILSPNGWRLQTPYAFK